MYRLRPRIAWLLGLLTLLSACGTPEAPGAGSRGGPATEPPGVDAPQTGDIAPPPTTHETLLTLDSHLDTPALLVQPEFDIMERNEPPESQVDLPRMIEGGLDGGFWVIYSQQGELTPAAYQQSRDTALLRALAIHEMVTAHPKEFALATEPADAQRIADAGQRVVYLSIENSYPLGEDLSLLETFYKLGVRMVGPVHFANNQFADSSTDPEGQIWNGLSPLGKELVTEANRLGIILDGSHAHDDVVRQLIELSATPIILSHSGASAVYDHPRNVSDELLKAVADSGGVVHINSYGGYLEALPENPERDAALQELYAQYQALDPDDVSGRQALADRRRAINEQFPPAMSNFDMYMRHFLHILDVIGPDHVGVGADWDGGGGVRGMEDVSALPRITESLLEAGYTEEDLQKIWSGNLLRLLEQAQSYAGTAAG